MLEEEHGKARADGDADADQGHQVRKFTKDDQANGGRHRQFDILHRGESGGRGEPDGVIHAEVRQGPEQADKAQIHQDTPAYRHDLQVGETRIMENGPCRKQHRRACQSADCLQADRIIFLGDLPCQKDQRGEQEGDQHRQQRGRADGREARLDDQQRAAEARRTRGDAPDPDLLAKKHPAHHKHDERVDKGDGQRIGKRQVAQRDIHGGDTCNVNDAADKDDTEDAPAHRNAPAGFQDDRNGQGELHPVAEQQDHHHWRDQRHGFCRRIAHRGEKAEPQHEEDPDDGAVVDHRRTLRRACLPVKPRRPEKQPCAAMPPAARMRR